MSDREISIDMDILKDVTKKDYLIDYLGKYKQLCQIKRDAYSLFASKLKQRHNIISIPLLVITSATSVIPALDINKAVGMSVGACAAILTAIQRYCAYAERSENARLISKSFGKIVRSIENTTLYIQSTATKIDPVVFTGQVEQIQRYIDSAHELASDIPWSLLREIDTVNDNVCCYPIEGTQGVKKIDTSFA